MTKFRTIEELNERMGRESGQTMSEYAVVLLAIVVAAFAAFGVLSTSVAKLINSVVGLLP